MSLHDNSETNDSKVFKLGVDLAMSYKCYNLRLKGQTPRSRGHKLQKHIEVDRVTGVSYALYRVLSL